MKKNENIILSLEEIKLMTAKERLALVLQKKVDDEIIGQMKFLSDKVKWGFVKRADYEAVFRKPNNDLNIAVILESPHIDEFDIKNLTDENGILISSRPLNNPKSRKGLKEMLNQNLSTILDNRLYNLKNEALNIVLINAIQNQCSLGFATKYFRDEHFLTLWKEKSNDFEERIKKINPFLIINCCTNGNIKKRTLNEIFDFEESNFKGLKFLLKDLVEIKLQNLINERNYLRFNHPSSFNSTTEKFRNDGNIANAKIMNELIIVNQFDSL